MNKDDLSPIIRCAAGFAGVISLIAGVATPVTAVAQPPPALAYQGDYSTPGVGYAYGPEDFGFYVAAGLGGTIMPGFNSPRYGVPGHFSPEAGARFSIAAGINFFRSDPFDLGAEFETGYTYNYLRSVTLAGNPVTFDGDLYQVPLLVNLVFKAHPTRDLTPYIGVGGGGDISSIHIRDFDEFNGNFHHNRYKTDADPAVQAFGGVRFRVWRFAHVGVEYKYLADFSDSTIATHSIMATFCMEF